MRNNRPEAFTYNECFIYILRRIELEKLCLMGIFLCVSASLFYLLHDNFWMINCNLFRFVLVSSDALILDWFRFWDRSYGCDSSRSYIQQFVCQKIKFSMDYANNSSSSNKLLHKWVFFLTNKVKRQWFRTYPMIISSISITTATQQFIIIIFFMLSQFSTSLLSVEFFKLNFHKLYIFISYVKSIWIPVL